MKLLASLAEAELKEKQAIKHLVQDSFALEAVSQVTGGSDIRYVTGSNYRINDDLSVVFHDSVKLVKPSEWWGKGQKGLPVVVAEAFSLDMSGTGITTLKGSPRIAENRFVVSHNTFLESLEHGPSFVGSFSASSTGIRTLKGGPRTVQGHYYIVDTPYLHSLEGLPDIIQGGLVTTYREDLPLLRLPLVHQLKEVTFINASIGNKASKVQEILNKHIDKGRHGALDLQRELIAQGFEGNAKP